MPVDPHPDAYPPSGAPRAAAGEPEARGSDRVDDDFLYHLYRGSDLLMHNRVGEAKDELERALLFQPQDAKSQDLLAGVYFRLGVYPRSIEIWERLVAAYPKDPTLRVNLALVLFKTGQADDATRHLYAALRVQPDHARAWGYLGLIAWRRGRLDEAREAFLRGGQAAMARRMEEEMGRGAEALARGAEVDSNERALREAAEDALSQLDADRPLPFDLDVASDDDAPRGAFHVVESGALRSGASAPQHADPPAHRQAEEPHAVAMPAAQVTEPSSDAASEPVPSQGAVLEAPRPLRSAVARWQAAVPAGAKLALDARGQLHVDTEGAFHARTSTLIAARGKRRVSPLSRRARGREVAGALGGEVDPLLRFEGPVAALFGAPEGRIFEAIELDTDVLYVVESRLFAFEEALTYESASLALSGAHLSITQLAGEGAAVLLVDDTPQVFSLSEGDELCIDPHRLVGWSGRLFPVTGAAAHFGATLTLRGEGVVFLV